MNNKQEIQEQWKEFVRDAYDSGIGIRKWCGSHNVSERQFYYWRKKLSNQTDEMSCDNRLVEIHPEENPTEDDDVVLELGNIRLVIHKHTSQETIEKVIRAMRNA